MDNQIQDTEERNKHLGSQLQKYRKAAHVTQEEMSKFCGVSKNHLSKIEKGVYKCPAYVLIDYAKRLDVSLDCIAELHIEKKDSDTQDNVLPELQSMIARLNHEEQKKLLVVLQALKNQK